MIWAEQSLDFLSYRLPNEANRGNEYPSGSERSITLPGLAKGQTFKVQARARYTSGGENNGPWSGPWTDTVTARVKDDPPAAPTGFTAGQVAHDSVTLTWTAPSSGSTVTSYRILRGTDANSLTAIADDTGSAGTEYTDTTVAAETTYYYAVVALSAGRGRGAVRHPEHHHAGGSVVRGHRRRDAGVFERGRSAARGAFRCGGAGLHRRLRSPRPPR